jgi:hypothetical protein
MHTGGGGGASKLQPSPEATGKSSENLRWCREDCIGKVMILSSRCVVR